MSTKVSLMVVNIDHYMSKLDVQEDLETIHQISKQSPFSCPVIRIFGCTPLGQRACVHIHGVLPYIYFRPENYLHATFDSLQKIVRLLPMLEKCLEELLHLRRQRIVQGMQSRQSSEQSGDRYVKKRKHINRLEIVKKKSIYGMMTEEIYFIQVFLHDPGDKKRLAEILDEGPLAGIAMQTFESHIPYLLQFTSDYNVPPMGWITLSKVKFRPPLPAGAESTAPATEAVAQPQPLVSSTPPIEHHPKPIKAMNEESPIFQFLGSAVSPMSSSSHPSRAAVMPTPSSNAVLSTSSPNLLQPGYYTQQTVSEVSIWKFQLHSGGASSSKQEDAGNTASTPLVSYNLDEKDYEEVQLLLQGLSEGDLVWSQVAGTPPPPLPLPQPPHQPPVPVGPVMEKDSTCELEFDSHAVHVENIRMSKAEFGAELWTEEKARCARLGISMGEQPEMPYSNSMDRTLQRKEKEYYDRFGSLMEKGKALRKNTKDILKFSKTLPSEVLSQFLTADDHTEVKDGVVDGKERLNESDSVESAFDEWARDTIHITASEATMQDSITKELMSQETGDVADSLVEDYVKSQRVSQQESIRHSTTGYDFSIADDDGDNEHSQDLIDKEARDILTSTQLDEPNSMVLNSSALPQTKMPPALPSVAENSPIIISLSAIPRKQTEPVNSAVSALASPMNLDRELEDSGWSYSTPPTLPPPEPLPKSSSKAIRFDVLKKVDYSQIAPEEPNINIDRSISDRKPPLPPTRRQDKNEFGEISLVSALGGKRSRSSASIDNLPHSTGILRTETSSAQKMRRTVSFAPNREDNDGHYTTVDRSGGSGDGLISPPVDYCDNVDSTPDKQRPTALSAMFSDPSGRIRVSSISISQAPFQQKPKNIAGKCLQLAPTSKPPCGYSLIPLELLGLPPSLNTPAHFSIKVDAEKEKNGLQAASGYTSYQSRSNRNINYIKDLPEFDGGDISTFNHYTDFSVDRLPYRTRCLIPTFMPPKLYSTSSTLLSPNGNEVESAATIASKESLNAPPVAGVFTPSSWLKSQIASPTQTPGSSVDSQKGEHRDVGRASLADHSDHMSRLIVLSMELFCCTRKDLLPNPKFDPIQCIVWIADDMLRDASSEQLNRFGGVICVVNSSIEQSAAELDTQKQHLYMSLRCSNIPADTLIDIVQTEGELFEKFINLVRDIDPDFLVGYENLTQSYGYFIKRGMTLGIHCIEELSRLPKEQPSFRNTIIASGGSSIDDDGNALDPGDPGIHIKGRTFLNNWQLMTAEVKLADASIQHVVEVVLKMTLPFYSHKQQTSWFSSSVKKHYTISYVYSLVLANLMLLEKLDLFRKMSECARLYGIDFYSVIHRGSQYRVEAALLARAHSQGYVLLSPSRQKVANQAPMEVIPLVLEPQSQFYTDPVVVLDFQSLYPSIMIAFNMCFSTIIGKLRPGVSSNNTTECDRVHEPDTTCKLGTVNYPESLSAACATLHIGANELNKMTNPKNLSHIHKKHDQIPAHADGYGGEVLDGELYKVSYDSNAPYMSPNGSVFVSPAVRKGILPMMLQEMLDTRVMVKTAMKRYASRDNRKHYRVLEKVLDARQLAIKLLSNVTYGYTAAGFSGRMPMAELADAIVQTGRSLLEHTIRTINSNPKWNARVVYGDTDSVFVSLPGRSLSQAFSIGEEISSFITSNTPKHIILKFEKVYYPSLLVTKKRYVGQCYENKKNLNEHHLDAKGIEMIRKDQCEATKKIQEKAIRLLFQTRDLSVVKKYLMTQWTKLSQDHYKLLLNDFIFYKEVRFGSYSSVSSQPPGAIVATKAVLLDEMAVPPHNWRVPYIVVYGPPNTALKHLVHNPKDVMRRGSNLRCNFFYYITKCINPALDRVLSMCGVNVFAWYQSMQRPKVRVRHINYDIYQQDDNAATGPRASMLKNYYMNSSSKKSMQMLMDQFTTQALCEVCREQDALPRKLVCAQCLSPSHRTESYLYLMQRYRQAQLDNQRYEEMCRQCASYNTSSHSLLFAKNEMVAVEACESLACDIFHERCRLVLRLEDYQLAVQDVDDQSGSLECL